MAMDDRVLAGIEEPNAGDALLLQSFEMCKRALARIARRFVKPEHVEDIVQETFLKTYEASARSQIQSPGPFMEATARNIAMNFSARFDNRPKVNLEELVIAGLEPDAELPLPEDCVDSQERLRVFCRAMRRLPVQCRRALLLKKVYGLDRQEVARHLGISESTVQKHICKGMALIVEYMDVRELPAVPRRSSADEPVDPLKRSK